MQKTLLAAALAVVSLSPLAAKADQSSPLNNFFVSGNLGQSNYRLGGISDKADVFQSVRVGYRWNNIIGGEVGYTYLGVAKDTNGFVSQSVKTRAAIIGVNAKYDFYGPWFVTGHGGYLRSRGNFQVQAGDISARQKAWNNGWYAGAGIGYNVTENVALSINYDNYKVNYQRGDQPIPRLKANVSTYSAGVEYKF
ncbi:MULTISPECIES: outer membrane protein [Dyella]|nr:MULTISPECIES: porin family protein [Dyella]